MSCKRLGRSQILRVGVDIDLYAVRIPGLSDRTLAAI
jgi:hypothetical protein